jgi:hypothetical protein
MLPARWGGLAATVAATLHVTRVAHRALAEAAPEIQSPER